MILTALLLISVFFHFTFKVKIYQSKTHLLITNAIILIVATIWDQYAISRGHWSFGRQFLLGPKIGFMPIEEYAFTLIVPYFGLVIFKILEKRLK